MKKKDKPLTNAQRVKRAEDMTADATALVVQAVVNFELAGKELVAVADNKTYEAGDLRARARDLDEEASSLDRDAQVNGDAAHALRQQFSITD